MASPKLPAQQALALSDPNNASEIFANSVAGIQIRDGIAHLTFSIIRPRHNTVGGTAQDEQVVTARLVLPLQTAAAMAAALNHLQTAMAAQQNLRPN